AGHTVTVGICWVPLVLLCVERAIQGRGWRWAVGGGVAYALFILGTHPQWTFYGSLLIGFWPLRFLTGPTTRREPSRPEALSEDSGGRSVAGAPVCPPSPPGAGGEGRGEGGLGSGAVEPASALGEPKPPSPPTPLPPLRGERGEEAPAVEVPCPSSGVILVRW